VPFVDVPVNFAYAHNVWWQIKATPAVTFEAIFIATIFVAPATRYEKRATNFAAMITIASIFLFSDFAYRL